MILIGAEQLLLLFLRLTFFHKDAWISVSSEKTVLENFELLELQKFLDGWKINRELWLTVRMQYWTTPSLYMELIDSIKDYPPTRLIESLKGTAFAFSFFFFNASLAKSLHSGAERATLGGFASKKKYELAPSQFPDQLDCGMHLPWKKLEGDVPIAVRKKCKFNLPSNARNCKLIFV